MKEKRKIEIIEFLRFVSLTEVFLIHYLNDYIHSENGLNIPMVSGKLGVAFFFVISAYLLVVTYDPNKPFLFNKVVQLLPKYEIILVMIFIASKIVPSLFRTFEISNLNFLKSAFLIPYRTEGVPYPCPMLPVAWTLIIQFFLFLVFWILIKIIKSVDKTAIILSLIFVLMAIAGIFLNSNFILFFSFCRNYMIYFSIGLIVAQIEKIVKEKSKQYGFFKNKNDIKVNHFICILLTLGFLLFSCFYDDKIVFMPLIFIIFLIVVLTGKRLHFPKSIIFMGKISYSFFLIHYLVVKVFTRILPMTRNALLVIVLMLFCYLLVIFVSTIYDKCVNLIIYHVKEKIKKWQTLQH